MVTCPNCNGNVSVVDVKHIGDETHRRKKCKACGYVFYTLEIVADDGAEYNVARRDYDNKRYRSTCEEVYK